MGLFGSFNFLSPVVVDCFSGSGTWNCPVGAKRIIVVSIGAGGGGGGGITPVNAFCSCELATGAGGCGGGGISYSQLIGSEIPSSVCVVVGSGGTGGVIASPGSITGCNGLNGGSSIFCKIGSPICAGGGAGGEGGKTQIAFNTVHTASGGAGGSGNFRNGGQGGCGYAFYSGACTDVNGRNGTFPTSCGGRPGGGGAGFRCPTTDGTKGASIPGETLKIAGVSICIGSSGEGGDKNVCCAGNGVNYAAGGGGGASPGNFLVSCGGKGSQGIVFVVSSFS